MALAVTSLVTAVGVTLFGLWIRGTEGDAQAPLGSVTFELSVTEPLDNLAARLEAAGLVQSARVFSWYRRVYAADVILEPGGHLLKKGSTPRELIAQLGRRQTRSIVEVNLPEGWDSFQIGDRLEQLGVCGRDAFLAVVFDAAFANSLIHWPTLEGYLYPASYQFRVNSEPERVVARLTSEALARFTAVESQLASSMAQRGGTLHFFVTLASVVQKEAASAAEVPTIAGVFYNRLNDPDFRPQRMLQSDPTAAYGCKLPEAPTSCAGFTGRVVPKMLRDAHNPYNTYKHAGLPPGPIGNPSEAALRAVIEAPATDFYFFVAGPDGKHRFSTTLEQHRRATRRGP
jgi:UPF0755 protein